MELHHKLHTFVCLVDKMLDKSLQAQLGVSLSQYHILSVVRRKSVLSQKDVAVSLEVTEAAVSRQIKGLVDLGVLQKDVNPENRRENLLSITKQGRMVFEKSYKILNKKWSEALNVLEDSDQARLARAVDILLFNHTNL